MGVRSASQGVLTARLEPDLKCVTIWNSQPGNSLMYLKFTIRNEEVAMLRDLLTDVLQIEPSLTPLPPEGKDVTSS